MTPYLHQVEYHETDQAGVVNNTYYYHWMENARIYALSEGGLSYAVMEENGLFGVTLANSCEYRRGIRFGQTVEIKTVLTDMDDRFFNIKYTIMDADTKKECAYGTSKHCFCGFDGHMISLKEVNPALYDELSSHIGEE